MLGKEDFTSSEVIDNIQVGDATVDIVGYVTKANNNFHSSKTAKFQKFVINNGKGKEVQVTGWNDNSKLLKSITEVGTIVYIGSTRATAIKNKLYNSGNVNFELLVKENTTIETFGSYEENNSTLCEQCGISDAYENINKKIKVEGIIKTPLKKYKHRDYEYIVGSITDCMHKLELKVDSYSTILDTFKKGDSIEVMGTMEQFPPGPPILRVEKPDHIKLIERDRISFEEIIQGFHNKI